MKKFRFGAAGSLLLLSQALPAENVAANQKEEPDQVQLLAALDETAIGTLELNRVWLKLGKKDKYGRATAAHVQMQEQHRG